MTTHPSLAEQVLGVHPPFDDPATMIAEAYTKLTGEQADVGRLLDWNTNTRDAVSARTHEIGLAAALYEIDPDVLEKSVVLNALSYTFTENRAPYGTVLGALPLYHTLYLEHTEPLKPKEPESKALLVGSISPLSSAAFAVLSKRVFQADPWIVDPVRGQYKERHGNFVQANGLSLSGDWSGSMHVVVTNRLLHMMLDADHQIATATPANEQPAIHNFAKEMFRLLESGGHLLLCEQPPQLDMQDFWCEGAHNRGVVAAFDKEMRTALDEAGFSKISITTGRETGSADFLFQPFNPTEPVVPSIERLGSLAIYAQKPR